MFLCYYSDLQILIAVQPYENKLKKLIFMCKLRTVLAYFSQHIACLIDYWSIVHFGVRIGISEMFTEWVVRANV